ncbi:MAG TPA: exopolysaccharide biosynthesis polyprenyl glycosylphosphotransferase [Oculatellaceae cyanobacterium]|jgi:exopolysaccharide biosynthesis polyprenyl glycosylphosphotransferase
MSTVNPDTLTQIKSFEQISISTLISGEVLARIPEHLRDTPFRVSFIYAVHYQKRIQSAIKRIVDVTAAFFGLCALALPLALIAVAIRLDSEGPILFKQKRIGLNGKRFYMYKFRSMYPDAEDRLAALLEHNEIKSGMFKMKNDPRVTRVGRFLRKYSLDEFPQLINVLRGEMSLVGPRPPLERELKDYKEWHYVRFSVLPGLTGEWQVNGRSSIDSFDDVVNLDFRYIRSWNLWLDFKILLKTIPVVLLGKDAA